MTRAERARVEREPVAPRAVSCVACGGSGRGAHVVGHGRACPLCRVRPER